MDVRFERARRHRHALVDAAVRVLQPREDIPPSEWATKNIVLDPEMSRHRPGPYDIDWKPWLRDIHDMMYRYRGVKRGLFCQKPSQIGFTRAIFNLMLYIIACDPFPFLYMLPDKPLARHWVKEHFEPGLEQLRDIGVRYKDESRTRSEGVFEHAFVGGRADFCGAGSVSGMISRAYQMVVIDEYDACLNNWKKIAGSPLGMAEGRTTTFAHQSWILAFSHPTLADRGINGLIRKFTDDQHWVHDCPHCGTMVRPHSTLIQRINDPERAVYACPQCDREITDAQRSRAVMREDQGGSGRFQTQLDVQALVRAADERGEAIDAAGILAQREFIGLSINGLANPDVTVKSLAIKLASAKDRDERQSRLNSAFGEEHHDVNTVVTERTITECIAETKQMVVPGGVYGARIVTVGVDVQAPRKNPTLFTCVSAWSTHGHEYVLLLKKLQGWPALAGLLRSIRVPLDGGGFDRDGNKVTYLGPTALGIDSAWELGQVCDFCRRQIFHQHTHAQIPLIPMQFVAYLHEDLPAKMPPKEKRINPMKPELGEQVRFHLHRDTWVRRTIGRWSDRRVTVQCVAPPELVDHVMANRPVPKPTLHGWDDASPPITYVKDKLARDDFFMAQTYGEVVASLVCGLDSIDELADVVEPDLAREGDYSPESEEFWRD